MARFDPGQPLNECKPRGGAWTVLSQGFGSGRAQDRAQEDREDNHVVCLPRHGQKIRDEIHWREQIQQQ